MDDNNFNPLWLILPILVIGIFFIFSYHQCSLCGNYGFFYNPHTLFGEQFYLCDNCEPYLSLLSLFPLFL